MLANPGWRSTAALARVISLEDIEQISGHHGPPHETPVLKLLSESKNSGYDLACIPLTNDKWRARWRSMCLSPDDVEEKDENAERLSEAWRSNPGFMKGEVNITRLDEAENIFVMLSDWLELDSDDDWVRHDAETALQQELAYASYLNASVAILPPPRNRNHVASYARAISICLSNIPYMQLSVRLPVYDPAVFSLNQVDQSASPSFNSMNAWPSLPAMATPTPDRPKPVVSPRTSEGEFNSTWEMWDVVRSVCDNNPRLTLTLDLTPPLPLTVGVLDKWIAEPTRQLLLPSSTFIANAKGYPVLPKGTQSFLRNILKLQPTVLLCDTNSGQHSRGGESAYSQYIRYLESTSPGVKAMRTPGTAENFAMGYQDYLQQPLQPLMDNLQSTTYHTFEQDPVKYSKYEEAIFRALSEWPKTRDRIVLCVAGAGRGPLVHRALCAIARSRRDSFIYAIEKNPNAFVTLQERKDVEWKDKVQIIFGDMRTLNLPEKVDILISELLGSLGDNELSPECLDGVMRFLRPDGISIPSSYSAYIAPLSSTKLFNEVRSGPEDKKTETPYVVMLQAVNILSGDSSGSTKHDCGPQIQECWGFEHPRKDAVLDDRGLPLTNSHNSRFAKLNFHIPHTGVLHGLAGYFEAVLYGEIGLSIHPQRKEKISNDMLSWFPMYFPFKEPLYLPENSELHVSIWRLTDQRRVWYEWYAEAFMPIMIAVPDLVRESSSSITVPPLRRSSPTVDALDVPPIVDHTEIPQALKEASSITVVKIGQTALHNPGGRSSWIGL